MVSAHDECVLIGWYIVYLRLKRNWLQYHLAEKSHTDCSDICCIESGRDIQRSTELRIAHALGIERWQLAKAPAWITKRIPWMKKKQRELKKIARAIRKAKGIKGKIPLEMWMKELERIRK